MWTNSTCTSVHRARASPTIDLKILFSNIENSVAAIYGTVDTLPAIGEEMHVLWCMLIGYLQGTRCLFTCLWVSITGKESEKLCQFMVSAVHLQTSYG